ncbi:MAG: glycosyltransferase family 92 protein [Desulfovibrio sp.]|nr:glycosyltransferase family 92 protein [Desulfovibrio sp.]
MQYCALCCIARDEDFYIEEWVDYHLLLGFDKIIIYDNHSKISLKTLLDRYIKSGSVIVNNTEGDNIGTKAQGMAYTHCFNNYKNDFVWIAVIDADEMIVIHNKCNIKAFLAEFENYGGVFLNWVFYGNPNMIKRCSKSMINNFIYRDKNRNTTGKSIVRPTRVRDFRGPHGPDYVYPYYAVNTEHFPLEPCVYSAQYCIDSAQINHYYARTKEDYELKRKKWKQSGLIFNNSFEDVTKNYIIKDESAIKKYEELKKISAKQLPTDFNSISELTDFFIKIINSKHFLPYIEEWLCNCVCKFPDEPLIWLFRSMLARKTNNPNLALHHIKQAFKFSGSSSLFNELAAVYSQLGDDKRKEFALEQARYKKHVEETTCA